MATSAFDASGRPSGTGGNQRSLHVRRSLARRRWTGTPDRSARRLVRWGVTADVLTASGLVFAVATAVAVGTGHLLIGDPAAGADRLPRPARRPGGQGGGHGVGPWRVLRLGDRPGGRRRPDGGCRLVPGLGPQGPPASCCRWPSSASASLVSYERAKAEALGHLGGQGRPDGAGRADDPARRRLPGLLAAGPGAVGAARPDRCSPPSAGSSGSGRPPDGPVRRRAVRAPGRRGRDGFPLAGPPQGRSARAADGRAGQPLARWRARRQEALTSRTGRARRARWSREQQAGSASRVRGDAARDDPAAPAGPRRPVRGRWTASPARVVARPDRHWPTASRRASLRRAGGRARSDVPRLPRSR